MTSTSKDHHRRVFAKTMIHESAHAFHRLVDDTSQHLVKENLPADVLDHVNTVRKELGPWADVLSDTWQRLHGTATIASDNYKGYAGANYKCEYPDVQSAVQAGFAREYGATNHFCTAPGSLDTHLCYAAWRSSYSSRASIGV